ncbi:hypothetical protein F4820DRAFT_467978 [Hypoxylon rubiginosum]|uniref:Uncharacterized protein n=1 Tax=Hypoxylon rubiginosum TaxID=110542 RepID=A0ACB9YIC1_9PEZI|nr:hypothetical protein F4820DRAFT_467978 [Hypoxylon rubiginosum]
MSPQAQKLTDVSQESIDSDVASDAHVARQHLVATELDTLAPTTVLQRSLTIGSIVATASSFAARSQSVKHLVDTQNYEDIGAGLQGIAYERLGSIYVTKKELPTNQGRRLTDEFAMHRKVSDAFTKYKEYSGDVLVPQPFDFVPKESLLPELLSRMPGNDRQPSDVATMEIILPLPKIVRKAMIQKFYPDKNSACDEHLVTQVLDERANKHCLARLYLGKRSVAMSKENFTLRNHPLTLNVMGDLALNVEQFAAMIGNAYAIMHWAANITGDDVEFVLGFSTSTENDFQHREVHMYLLDFGQCDTVDMNEDQDDIFQAFKGSLDLQHNQLYLPHPKRSAALYQAWKSAYLSAARKVIQHEGLPFDPEEFLEEYEEYLEDFDPQDSRE